VRVANDGPAALEAVKDYSPEVVILDIGLPGLDGYRVARELRSMPHMKQARLIALTGYGQPEDRRIAMDAGFDDYLVKPVPPEALEKAVG
jgi:CheY-like chemotaxis protein